MKIPARLSHLPLALVCFTLTYGSYHLAKYCFADAPVFGCEGRILCISTIFFKTIGTTSAFFALIMAGWGFAEFWFSFWSDDTDTS